MDIQCGSPEKAPFPVSFPMPHLPQEAEPKGFLVSIPPPAVHQDAQGAHQNQGYPMALVPRMGEGWTSPCPASTLHCSWCETFCLRAEERGQKYKIKDHHAFISLFFTAPTVQCTSVPSPSPSYIFPQAPLPCTSPVQASSLPFPVFPRSELMLSKSHPQ